MKKFSWKKVLSLVLVAALVVGTLKISDTKASAEENTEHPTTVTTTTDDGIVITKSLVELEQNGSMATATINITVDGADATIPTQRVNATDVVFVMDLSNSMDDYGRLTKAKAAAVDFAKGILTDANKNTVRIGIASFGTSGYENLALTNNISSVTSTINSLSVAPGNDSGGTNIQAGIIKAEDILKDSRAENKIVVVLSDGEPTYSYKATAYSSELVTLSDGSKKYLLTAFDTSTRQGSGSNYTFTEYTVKASGIVDGWYDAEDKLVTSNNGKVEYSGSLSDGKTGTYVETKTYRVYSSGNRYYYTDDNRNTVFVSKNDTYKSWGNRYYDAVIRRISVTYKKSDSIKVNNNGLPAISEAQLAKNNGIVFYSISYDTEDNSNANFVMKNIASESTKYYTASSANTTSNAINSVMNSITTSINLTIAAAKGTSLQDEFPSYMKATAVTGENVTLTGEDYGNTVNWTLADLDANTSKTITITATVDLNAMVAAYAADNSEYADAAAVKKAIADGGDIWFDLNKMVTLNYTNKDGEKVSDSSLNNIQGETSNGVPESQFDAYNYIVTYKFDGQTVGTKTGAAFAGETVSFEDIPAYTTDTAKFDYSKRTVTSNDVTVANNAFTMPEKNVNVVVTYGYKDYTVTFKNGDQVVSTKSDYHYGDATQEPAEVPTKAMNDQYTYTFKAWTPEVAKTVTADAVYAATFNETLRSYTVRFQDYNGAKITETEYEYGDTVVVPPLPTRDSDNTTNYTCTGWDKTVSTTCTGAVTYTAIYSTATRNYTVTFKNYDGTVISTKTDYEYNDTVVMPTEAEMTKAVKEADETYTYSFKCWDKQITAVFDDAVYTATFSAIEIPYTVTFVDEDGTTVLGSKTYKYGDTVEVPKDPTKAADVYNTYTFAGWTVDGQVVTVPEKVTASATYKASYTAKTVYYTVTFLTEDGKVITSKDYTYNATVEQPAAPAKTEDNTYTYEFAGWTPSVAANVEGNATYRATYKGTFKNYTIIFKDADGTGISKKEDYHYGDTVVVPDDPTKDADETNTYKFAGWTPSVAANVEGNATYIATYDETKIEYTIIFKNWDGEELSKKEDYHYGDTVEVPAATPSKNEDNTYTYTFAGWDKTVTTVAKDETYTATYKETFKNYTVKFVDYNDKLISEKTDYHYGNNVVVPADPKRAADETYTYEFAGWDSEVVAVAGDATYKATYNATYIDYTVKFVDYNDKLISEKTDYHYGNNVVVPDNPTKEADETYTYTFAGWDKEVTTVSKDETYTATYGKTYKNYTVKFLAEDGETVISEKNDYHFDDAITAPADQTKEADARYTYKWAGWLNVDTNVKGVESKVNGDLTYKATFDNDAVKYTVTFYNEGTQVSTANYEYEEKIIVPDDPTKAADETYTYTFAGWTPEVQKVCTGTAVYYAVYKKENIIYNVTFYNEDGITVVSSASYTYGQDTKVPETPAKAATQQYTFKFAGWTPEVAPTVTTNAAYVASFEAITNKYVVTFINEGKEYSKGSYDYGTEINAPSIDPVKAADQQYTYVFVGWKAEDAGENATFPQTVIDDITFYAVYENVTNEYTVTFLNVDGQPLDAQNGAFEVKVKYGETVSREAVTFANSLKNNIANAMTDENQIYSAGDWMMAEDDKLVSAQVALTEAITDNLTVYASYNSRDYKGFTVTYMNSDNETVFGTAAVKEFDTYKVREDGPALTSTPWTVFTFAGWSLEPQRDLRTFDPVDDIIHDVAQNEVIRERVVFQTGALPIFDPAEDEYAESLGFRVITKIGSVTEDITLYPVYASAEHLYTVTFVDYDGTPIATEAGIHYSCAATAPEDPTRAGYTAGGVEYTYTFSGWDKDFSKVTEDMTVTACYEKTSKVIEGIPLDVPEVPGGDPTPTVTPTPTPEVTSEPTPEVTPEPTPEVTPEPTPEVTPEPTPEVIEVPEETETPEGTPEEEEEIIVPEETETPEGTPEEEEEEILIPEDETPQGMPQTGVVAAGVFYGIGSACIALGSVITRRARRKEEEE